MDKQAVIIRAAERLPVETRKVVANAIIQSIDRDINRVDATTRFNYLVTIASAVLGVDYHHDRRDQGSADIRTLCAKAMRLEKYTFYTIADAMGKDHSTIAYMVRRADDMAAGYMGSWYKTKYKEFINKI